MILTADQQKELLKPIDPGRVGKDGKGFSHVEAWDIRKRMNQIFGFGNWSADVTDMVVVAEKEVTTRQGKPAWYVVYRARCTVTIGNAFSDGCQYTEWAAGDATNPVLGDAHDQAIKTAESQAFKRCCVNLGDQFGLSLYKDGSMEATVQEVVGQEHADDERVPGWLQLLDSATTADELQALAGQFRGSDLSQAQHKALVDAYKLAQQRVQESG